MNNNENINIEPINMNKDSELDAMFIETKQEEKQKEMTNDKTKVLVKTNDNSLDEGGYGTVVGVIVVIISVCFILSALFISMLS